MNLVEFSRSGLILMKNIKSDSLKIKSNPSLKERLVGKNKTQYSEWIESILQYLETNELFLEKEQVINPKIWAAYVEGVDESLNGIYLNIDARRSLILEFAKDIEKNQKKHLIIITIEEFDNFKNIKEIKLEDIAECSRDYFLEDDVENEFLKALGEPFKEIDNGSETRDLFTDRLKYKGRRVPSAFMFKGRGRGGELRLNKCGKNGDQILKLSKNNSAECFVIQHTNKISQDVREALQDHVLANTKHQTVYLCFIDGSDTARFMKSVGTDMRKCGNKTHKNGRG